MSRQRSRGLTLLEMLVTLVIAAMVATLMSEGLFQLGQVERRLGSGQLQARLERLHALWLQQCLEGLRAGEPGTPEALVGGARSLKGISSMLPLPEPAGPMPVSLAFTYGQSTDETELRMVVGPPDSPVQSAVLARWRGDAGYFRYLDQRGEWLRDWPVVAPNAPLLPRAVAVHGARDELVLVAAMQASAQSLGKRVDIDKLP